jgi:hypothetical protein
MTAATSPSPSVEFNARLRDHATSAKEIADYLDALSHAERVEAIRGTGRSDQRRVWELADGFSKVSIADLVATEVPDLVTVRHIGKNTLPLFTEFEKRFCRLPDDDAACLAGFNFQTLSTVTGPGYFVASDAVDRPEVLVDYRRLPDQHPSDWPAVKSNERGLSRFVYGFMVDTLRRVSEHVTVGSAARKGKDLGSWFLLARRDDPSPSDRTNS